jgi:hypothetical protein
MRQDSLIEHIWARHKYSVLARSRNIHDRVSAMVSSEPPLVVDALELIAEALASPPSRTGWNEAMDKAWKEVKKGGIKKGYTLSGFQSACKKGRDDARRYLFEAATVAGHENLVASSLLDDTPLPGFAFFKKGEDWWQVREKNGRLSCLPLNGLLTRASSSARREAVLHGEGILRKIAGTTYPDPRFAPALRTRQLWNESWSEVTLAV